MGSSTDTCPRTTAAALFAFVAVTLAVGDSGGRVQQHELEIVQGRDDDSDRGWIVRIMDTNRPLPQTQENHTASAPLCFKGHHDLDKVVRGSVLPEGKLLGASSFPHEGVAKIPYQSKSTCADKTEKLHLVPDDCHLPMFNPETFLDEIRGRRMIFWGDSVMRQFFVYITLRLKECVAY